MKAASINQKEFENLMAQGKTVLVDYWAPWCSYCRRIGPAYDAISQQYQDQIHVVKINIDDNSALAEAEGIEVIPTLVLYREGKVLSSIVAPESKAKIEAFLRESLEK